MAVLGRICITFTCGFITFWETNTPLVSLELQLPNRDVLYEFLHTAIRGFMPVSAWRMLTECPGQAFLIRRVLDASQPIGRVCDATLF